MAPPAVASLVARDVIRGARDCHASFDARRHPDPTVLRALSRYQRRLAQKIMRRTTHDFVVELETALPLASFSAGITVPDYKVPVQVEATHAPSAGQVADRHPINLVPWEAQARWHRAAYLKDHKLYLTGQATDWTEFASIIFAYVPEVATLTALGDVLALPNSAEPCLVAYLASFMAGRGVADEGIPQPNQGKLDADWLEQEADLLDEMAGHTQAEVDVIREVF